MILDTLRQIQEYESRPYLLKKPLKVIFEGEEGYDAGGVKKELFLLLMKELLSPDYGMFSVDPEVSVILQFIPCSRLLNTKAKVQCYLVV